MIQWRGLCFQSAVRRYARPKDLHKICLQELTHDELRASLLTFVNPCKPAKYRQTHLTKTFEQIGKTPGKRISFQHTLRTHITHPCMTAITATVVARTIYAKLRQN